MNLKKLSSIIQKAKQTYSSNSQSYNKILTQRARYNPGVVQQYPSQVQSQVQENSNSVEGDDAGDSSIQSPIQQPMMYGGGGYQSPVNVIGGSGSGAPINIIAKNYINPDNLDDEGGVEEIEENKKSKTLAKLPDKLHHT